MRARRWLSNGIGYRSTRVAVSAGLLALAAGALGGCVSQQAYDDLAAENRSLRSRNAEQSAELNSLRGQADLLRQGSGSATATAAELRTENQRLQNELRNTLARITDLENQLSSATFGSLDPTTDRALSRLASQYPNLITYDANQGLLRFASDLTFASGSADVQAGARASLQALARILTQGEAASYDVVIVGHTDSQRISAATAQRHPTNVHLSAHRAIGVRSTLTQMNVPAGRIQVAGWGEHRPLVANTASGNTPENRRVEIYLRPSTRNSSIGAAAPAGGAINPDRDGLGADGVDPIK